MLPFFFIHWKLLNVVFLWSSSIDLVTWIIKNHWMKSLGEYFAVLTCRKPLTNLCAFVTLMQLCFPPCFHFLLSHMQCWHGWVIEQNWFLTVRTNLSTHLLQFNLSIFSSIRLPDLGSNDLCNIAVTMHCPFPIFPTIMTFWKKRVTTLQLWLG